MAVRVDVSAVEQAIDLLRQFREASFVSKECLAEYLAAPGMLLLKRHLQRYGGFIVDEVLLAALFEEVLGDPVM